eukprot:gene13446-biopygen1992
MAGGLVGPFLSTWCRILSSPPGVGQKKQITWIGNTGLRPFIRPPDRPHPAAAATNPAGGLNKGGGWYKGRICSENRVYTAGQLQALLVARLCCRVCCIVVTFDDGLCAAYRYTGRSSCSASHFLLLYPGAPLRGLAPPSSPLPTPDFRHGQSHMT